jgi:hypothetical protein
MKRAMTRTTRPCPSRGTAKSTHPSTLATDRDSAMKVAAAFLSSEAVVSLRLTPWPLLCLPRWRASAGRRTATSARVPRAYLSPISTSAPVMPAPDLSPPLGPTPSPRRHAVPAASSRASTPVDRRRPRSARNASTPREIGRASHTRDRRASSLCQRRCASSSTTRLRRRTSRARRRSDPRASSLDDHCSTSCSLAKTPSEPNKGAASSSF